MKHIKLFEQFVNESSREDELAQSEFGLDYDQLGKGEKEWVDDEIANASKVNEAKQYKLGDKYSSDFDYDGMLEMGSKAKVSWGVKKLQKLQDSFTDVNYHSESQGLGIAIDYIEDGDKKGAVYYMDMFNDACKDTLED